MSKNDRFFDKKREWSIVKDTVLRSYLQPYIDKIGTTKVPITIVDCFAGKGEFADGTPGSPKIICDKIDLYLEKKPFAQINSILIEKKWHKDLKVNMIDYNNTKILPGTFENNSRTVLEMSKRRNIFLYIDPYGIKSLELSRLSEFKNAGFKSVEMLINFNSKGFLREGCRILKLKTELITDEQYDDYIIDDNADKPYLNEIAGGDYWIEILKKYHSDQISMYQAEELFMNDYMKQFSGVFEHVIDIPIKDKMNNLPRYRLIFGTDHVDGLVLMADNMKKRWTNMQKSCTSGQTSLFDHMDTSKCIDQLEGFEFLGVDPSKCYRLDNEVLSIIEKNNGYISRDKLSVEIIEKFKFYFSTSDVNTVLKELEAENRIEVIRKEKYTKTNKLSKSMQKVKAVKLR